MKKIILAIGSITTAIIPVAAVIACGNKNEPKGNPSNEDDKNTGGNNNSSSNGVNIPSKYLNDPNTIDYITKTGYVPERPYDDYYESDFESVASSYWSETDEIFGDKEDEMIAKYTKKYEEQDALIDENTPEGRNQSYDLINRKFDLLHSKAIPYLLFYDYAVKKAHSQNLFTKKDMTWYYKSTPAE